MSIWDEFKDSDEVWKPVNPGDAIVGTLTAVRVRNFDDGSRAPQLMIRRADGVEVKLIASQTQLQRKLAEVAPTVGGTIAIQYTHQEDIGSGKTLKHFNVEFRPGAANGGSLIDQAAVLQPGPGNTTVSVPLQPSPASILPS